MRSLALTQIYLGRTQKKALAACAEESNRKVSEVVREAVNIYLMGVTMGDLKMLGAATARAQQDIEATPADNCFSLLPCAGERRCRRKNKKPARWHQGGLCG